MKPSRPLPALDVRVRVCDRMGETPAPHRGGRKASFRFRTDNPYPRDTRAQRICRQLIAAQKADFKLATKW